VIGKNQYREFSYFERSIQIWTFMRLQISLVLPLTDEIIKQQYFKQAKVTDYFLTC